MEGSVELFSKHSKFCFASFFLKQMNSVIHVGNLKTFSKGIAAIDSARRVSEKKEGSVEFSRSICKFALIHFF